MTGAFTGYRAVAPRRLHPGVDLDDNACLKELMDGSDAADH